MRSGLLDKLVKPLGLDKPRAKERIVEEPLEVAAKRALTFVYMADVGKSGNPPAVFQWWARAMVHLDGRISQILEHNGFVEGRNRTGGIPSEIRLTKKGASIARQDVGKAGNR